MTDLHRHCVLLVDDYENGRRRLALYLDAKGYEAHGAADGSDALLLLATGRQMWTHRVHIWPVLAH